MAQNTQLRVSQIAKDFNVKNKVIIDVLATMDIEGKPQTALDPIDFGILLNEMTKASQITNLDDYLTGKIKISPAAEEKKAEPAPAPKAEEKKAEPAPAPKAEEKKAEPAPAPKAEEKKAEPVPAPKVEEKKAEQRPADNRGPRPQSNDRQGRPAPAQNNRFDNRDNRDNRGQDNRGGQRPAGQNDRFAPRPDNRFQGGAQGGGRFDNRFDNRDNRDNRGPKPGNNKFGGQNKRQDESPSASYPKFQAKPIVRGTTAPGEEKPRGATRVVDTRGSSVDLSKYDERLDQIASDAGMGDHASERQKLKKQNTRDAYSREKEKERMAMEKLRKQGVERAKKQPLQITIPEEIAVGELASRLKITASEVIKKLMMMGVMATVNQVIDYDTAFLVADELGAIATKEVVVTIEEKLFDESEDDADALITRDPVVCVMGHVDHGKTSILDAIRHTNVTAGEAGGITQHIGAYRVEVNGKPITFLDTPGHEAFTAMRARGAMATDIAILVVAADDGIMPQTIEAINHAKAAGVEIIVAINKMDKPTANPDAIKQSLTTYELVPEEWGGDVICVPVSALTRMGIDDLLENVLLVAEMKELKANPDRKAKGIVIEAKLDKGRGPVATVLVQNGTLKHGDIVIAGTAVGRVRAMNNDKGRSVKEAGPSVPVEIIGLAEVPQAGDIFNAVEDERMARELADQRKEQAKEEVFKANARVNLDDLFTQITEGIKDLNIIVKADVGGSAEAVKQSLEKLTNEEVKVRIIHTAVGGITEGDVMLAAASNAIIVGFNVRPDKGAIDSAERQGVDIRTYRIIYDCIEEIQAAMKGMLAPKFKEVLLGHAEVRQTIHVPGVGTIAGSYIQDGKISRNAQIRVIRDGVVIFEDKISSLKRFKDDAKEVMSGYECGVGLEKFNDIKIGDVLEAFVMEEVAQ